MTCTVALAQTRHPAQGDVVSLVSRFARRAREQGADIVVFPESLMTRFEEERQAFLADAQELDGPFARAIDRIAAQCGLWILYNLNELNPHGGKPYNTAVLTDATGRRQSVYRKVHLFDSEAVRESERMTAGSEICAPVDTPFGRIGFATCYDLRFPEHARTIALAGCDLLLFPAAWVDGPAKQLQWEGLLRARAIENELFVAGVCRCDTGYVGTSYVFAPDGHTLAASSAKQEDLVIATLDMHELAQMRACIPVFEHRRPDLYR